MICWYKKTDPASFLIVTCDKPGLRLPGVMPWWEFIALARRNVDKLRRQRQVETKCNVYNPYLRRNAPECVRSGGKKLIYSFKLVN